MTRKRTPQSQFELYEEHDRGWLTQVEVFDTEAPIRGFVGAMIIPTFGIGNGQQPSPAGPRFRYFEDYAAANRILGARTEPRAEPTGDKRYLRAGVQNGNLMVPILDFSPGGETNGRPIALVSMSFAPERLYEIAQAMERWHRRYLEGES